MRAEFFNNSTINSIIKRHFEKELSTFSDIKYVYAIMNKSNPVDVAIISNRQEWFRIYKQNNFQFIDPVVITALNRITPFSWDENFLLSQGIKSLSFFDMARNHDIINGYTFVLHDQYNNLVMLSIFSENECNNNIEDIILRNKSKLHMLLITTHEKTIYLYQKQQIDSDFEKMNNRNIFSHRENEIIYWISVGKSYQEIAIITGVKVTTVKYHIANAVKKLGVNNAKHAIRLGVEMKLIRPVFPDKNDNS
ncbi:LuxR family transcriptional regulator [Erwinia persicina]|uniref:helix-turn-helix transcriptional regulator n=1 Tax=Erwinia persicina TaxID=55211 RepID=UPI0021021C51|nr:LuxR family transcriptional regulator [Erwinia persicina]MCQ4106993.1 LuxR family transcriptional regulator [Erwinia persicina]UTX11947.1 LuxR family transcriptional regulator [Erwinia persicina]